MPDESPRSYPTKDCYETLGVDSRASQEVISATFKRLAGIYHEDRLRGEGRSASDIAAAQQKLKELSEAYNCIHKSKDRIKYDEWRRLRNQPPKPVVSPGRIDFGNIEIGDSKTARLEVRNEGGPVSSEINFSFQNDHSLFVASVVDAPDGFPIFIDISIETNTFDSEELLRDVFIVTLDSVSTNVSIQAKVKPINVAPSSAHTRGISSASPVGSYASSGSPPATSSVPSASVHTAPRTGMDRGWAIALGWIGGILFYQVLGSLLSAAATFRSIHTTLPLGILRYALMMISSILAGIGITKFFKKNYDRGGMFAWGAAIALLASFVLLFTVGSRPSANHRQRDEFERQSASSPTVAETPPISQEDQREHELLSQAQQLFAARSYEAALAACNEALILNAGDRTAIKLKQNIESALTSANAPVQATANPTMNSASSSPPATMNGPELALKGSSSVAGTAKDVNGTTGTKSQPATDINPIQPRSETDALELLAQVQSAMGGRDRLAEIRDWQRQESDTWLPDRGTTQQTVSFVGPSTMRVDVKGGNRVVNFSNGKSGWTWSSTTGPARNLPSLTATGMAFRALPDLMLSDTKPGRTMRLLSPGVLEISDDNHDSAKVTIDLSSHLPQKVSWTNLDGATLEETYSGWKTVNRTLWWFHMTRSRDGAVFLLDKVREYRVNSGVTEQALATQPDQTRQSYVPSSSLSTGQPTVMHTDADRRGTLTLFGDHIEYRDDGMGTDGGRAPYGPNPANSFTLSCSEIENLKSYGFRPIVFGSFQVVISAHKKKFHIPALHGDSVVKAIRQECGLLSSEKD